MRPQLPRQGKQLQGFLQGHRLLAQALRQRSVFRFILAAFLPQLHVRTVAAAPRVDRLAGGRILSQRTRSAQQFQRLFERDILVVDAIAQGSHRRAMGFGALAELHEVAVGTQPSVDGFTGFRMLAQQPPRAFLDALERALLFRELLRVMAPEFVHHRDPVFFPVGHRVQRFLHACGEVVIDVIIEMAGKELGHHPAFLSGHEVAFFHDRVLAVADLAQGLGVGGRPPDSMVFERLDQTRLAVARRRFGEMLFAGELPHVQYVALLQRWQRLVPAVRGACQDLEKARMRKRVPGGPEASRRVAIRTLGRCLAGRELGAHTVVQGVAHLAGDGAPPDDAVQAVLVEIQPAPERFRSVGNTCRPYRFMRFLRVAGLGAVPARRRGKVIRAQFLADVFPDLLYRFARHLHGIGPHVRDQSNRPAAGIDPLVQRLRHPHGPLRLHADLA